MDRIRIQILLFIMTIIIIVTLAFIYIRQRMTRRIITSRTNDNPNWADDVTGMNGSHVVKTIYPINTDDIITAIAEAKRTNRQIIPRGQRHTMGGHTIPKDGYVLDMKYMNKILNVTSTHITVQAGITWDEVIKYLNNSGHSPMTLQSYSTFSVGGTLSVNAHGITNDDTIEKSVKWIKVVTHDGVVHQVTQYDELYQLVIGGYGLFGVIVEACLQIVHNHALVMKTYNLDVDTFESQYAKVLDDPTIDVKLARINTLNFNNIDLYVFHAISTDSVVSKISNEPNEMSHISQLMYKWMIPNKTFQNLRYYLERTSGKPLDWNHERCDRNELLYESAQPMSQLYNPIVQMDRTHILQEFFVPNTQFKHFMNSLKAVFKGQNFKFISLLNITIRYLHEDSVTFLRYAKTNMYAFVLYYRMERSIEADKELETVHMQLANAVLKLGGTFYLPYRHHYTQKQLQIAYPMIGEFFVKKLKYDPQEVFSNSWYKTYCPF